MKDLKEDFSKEDSEKYAKKVLEGKSMEGSSKKYAEKIVKKCLGKKE